MPETPSRRKTRRLSRGWTLRPTGNDGNRDQSSTTLNDTELVELYSRCIQLSAQNKINQKNTWSLNLIDNLDDVLNTVGTEKNQSLETTNFQMASCTLDASVKIYSYRVDSVHNDAFKVLGGLNMNLVDKSPSANEKADESKDGTSQKSSRKVGSGNTLEKNPANLTLKNVDVQFDVDPLFRKTSAAFDKGGANGLLQQHLTSVLHGDEVSILLDQTENLCEQQEYTNADAIHLSELRGILSDLRSDNLRSLPICASLAGFKFNDPSEGQQPMQVDDVDDDDDDDDDDDGDGDADNEDLDSVEGAGNVVDGGFDHDFENVDEPTPEGDNAEANDVMRPLLLFDYGRVDVPDPFAAPSLNSNWAGPAHWKFTGQPAKTLVASANKKKKREKKKVFFIDFFNDNTEELEKEFAPAGRAATTLSDAVLERASSENTTLPPDMHYTIEKLTSLFNKPNCFITLRAEQQQRHHSHIETPQQPDGFEPPLFEAMNTEFEAPDSDSDAEDWLGGAGLVEKPRMVNKIDINYAKIAKKVDVKALKTSIWTKLCENPSESENVNPNIEQVQPTGAVQGERSFRTLLESLPEKLPNNTLEDVSVPFCFICLLHLANEKNLAINMDEESSDLLITQG